MKGARIIVVITFLLPAWAGCGGSTEVNNTDALTYIGISVGKVFNYDIDIGLTLPQEGEWAQLAPSARSSEKLSVSPRVMNKVLLELLVCSRKIVGF